MDMRWDEPTPFQLEQEKQKAEDHASSLIHLEPEHAGSYKKKAVLNPDAIPDR